MATANTTNHTHAVDKLAMMFPTIERPTIENIVVNECGGDTNKSIVILTKIEQFNNSNANAKNETANAGEYVVWDDDSGISGWYVVWDIAAYVFGSMQLWILSRAMHPANTNCGCVHDGIGDGNVTSSGQPQAMVMMQVAATQSEVKPIAASAPPAQAAVTNV
eukprot:940710_1